MEVMLTVMQKLPRREDRAPRDDAAGRGSGSLCKRQGPAGAARQQPRERLTIGRGHPAGVPGAEQGHPEVPGWLVREREDEHRGGVDVWRAGKGVTEG